MPVAVKVAIAPVDTVLTVIVISLAGLRPPRAVPKILIVLLTA